MAGVGPGADDQINVFEVEGRYLLKHYFEDSDIYGEMKPYYNNQQYRFEISDSNIGAVLTFLSQEGFEMIVVDTEDLEEFIVAVRKYRDHPDNIFKESVMQRSTKNYHCFLMKDRGAVKSAVKGGGAPFSPMDIENPFRPSSEA